MCAKLVVAVIVVSFNGRVLDYAAHALNLTVGPQMVWLGQPMLKDLPRRLAIILLHRLRDGVRSMATKRKACLLRF